VGREASRKGFQSKTSIEHAYPKGTKPIPVNDKAFLEDPKKWLDTYVKPLWEGYEAAAADNGGCFSTRARSRG
jgi:hypothetical protein